jgi:hypothetical protein
MGRVTRIGDRRNAYRFFVVQLQKMTREINPLEKLELDRRIKIK